MERTPIKSQHTKLTLEMKILPPLLPGFELATFRSRVRRSTSKLSGFPVLTIVKRQKLQWYGQGLGEIKLNEQRRQTSERQNFSQWTHSYTLASSSFTRDTELHSGLFQFYQGHRATLWPTPGRTFVRSGFFAQGILVSSSGLPHVHNANND